MRRRYVDGPFGQIHFRDGGAGRPLVLLHQAPMTSRQFETVYPLFLARGYRPIGIDAPGFGESDGTPMVPRIEDWSEVVAPVLDALELSRVDVLGHHTGALVAVAFALAHPERIRSLVMHGAVLPTPEERRERLAHFERSERNFVYKPDGSHLVDVFNLRMRLHGPDPDPKLLTRYVVEQFMGSGEFWHGHHAAYQYDLAAALPRLPARTLVVSNTGDVIHATTLRIREHLPEVRLAILEGGGVDIVDEQPAGWTRLVCDYLDEAA